MRFSIFLLSLVLVVNSQAARAGELEEVQADAPEVGVAEPDAAEIAEAQMEAAEVEALTANLAQEISAAYSYVDQGQVVPKRLLSRALAYYHAHGKRIRNKRYLTVVDFSRHSSKDRMFIVDMVSGAVKSIHVAHGKGSDSNNDGYATNFSNKVNSEASSLGFYLTAETYHGNHGLSMRLDGLSSTNSKARERSVVLHGADYVREADVKAGRSWGCPAVSMGLRSDVIELLKGGSLIFAGR